MIGHRRQAAADHSFAQAKGLGLCEACDSLKFLCLFRTSNQTMNRMGQSPDVMAPSGSCSGIKYRDPLDHDGEQASLQGLGCRE